MRVLHVAEKPSVARELAHILCNGKPRCAPRKGNGNPVWTFDASLWNGRQDTHIVTSVRGHVMTIDFEPRFRSWHAIDPASLFDAKLIKDVKPEMTDIVRDLQLHARRSQMLVLWLDCDREGENIALEVQTICKDVNQSLTIKRARFSALTNPDVWNAVNHLDVLNTQLAEAVEARQELDFRLGAAFTRWQTLNFQDKFSGLEKVISYGPCQFPTLGFVVDRYREIETFVPRKFWSISVAIESANDGRTTEFQWKRSRLYDHFTTVMLYTGCVRNPLATVMRVDATSKSKWKPLPLATVEMQKRASRFLHIGSEETMKIAEKLYQSGWISYPRTETDSFKRTMNLHSLVSLFSNHSQFGSFAQSLLGNASGEAKFLWPRNGKKDDEAHPPIHPTKSADRNQLQGNEWRVYEFIVRHFLACCSQDAKGMGTSIDIGVDQEEFTTSGLVVKDHGYLEIYVYEKWTDKTAPNLETGQQLMPSSIVIKDGETQPPSLLSEPELIGLMDQHGIGTDATIAEHIKTIQQREYAQKTPEAKFVPTTLGMALICGYSNLDIPLGKPYLRAEMEADCTGISRGQKGREQVVQDCLAAMRQVYQTISRQKMALEQELGRYFSSAVTTAQTVQNSFSQCGKCNETMQLKLHANKRKRFAYCVKCAEQHVLPSKGELQPFSHVCPLCNYQAIHVAPGEGYSGKGYNLCPYCYSNVTSVPRGELIRNSNHEESNQVTELMPCFKCPASDRCLLAQSAPTVAVMRCGADGCNGELILRRTSTGTFLAGCKSYPTCKHAIYLPKSVRQATVQSEYCTSCQRSGGTVKIVEMLFSADAFPTEGEKCEQVCLACNSLPAPVNNYLRDSDPQATRRARTMQLAGEPRIALSSSGVSTQSEQHEASRVGDTDAIWAALELNDDIQMIESSSSAPQEPIGGRFFQPPQPTNERHHLHSNGNRNTTNPYHNARNGPASTGGISGTNEPPLCNKHNETCVVRRSSSAANPDREFYCCARPRDQGCGFQCWVDALSSIPAARSDRSQDFTNNSNTNTSGSAGGDVSTCFRCGMGGHWARDCPNNTNEQQGSLQSYGQRPNTFNGGQVRGRGRGRGTSRRSRARGR